ncbi:DUF262 domain-containing protein [Protaetiibacter mangrovi]|uniref:DUF262 domain-containing protein n=1 Tax=Protaetiibacter mangrovi TaxID=2970926 RepID=A0ABT1ZIJ4_9MICO|nr:DUF262 domain-containing protein [Protaetiibacter mangrovi]MCS0500523.1 DUF262 domain-containing protein [Protaetiibacter mangrovi]
MSANTLLELSTTWPPFARVPRIGCLARLAATKEGTLPESFGDGDDESVEELELDIDSPEELDESEDDDPDLSSSERELLTSVLDYNLNTLADLVSNEQIDLSPRYQRRDRWKADRQSRLIESFFMNVPIPPIFLNEDDYGKYSVIDGKQRLTAVHSFMRGRLRLRGLKVYTELNDKTYDDLEPSLKAIISTRANLRATIILRQSDKNVKFEVFRRLNTGGVTLNPQEIRNSTWPGPLNDLMLDLSEDERFRRLLGITRPATSTLYKEMRDVELVLRFFAFRSDWATFSGGMAKRLDRFMADNQRPTKSRLAELREDFLRTLEIVEAAFDDKAFRRFNPDNGTFRSPILAALFDAQMFAAMGRDLPSVSGRDAEFIDAYKQLFTVPEFRQSIDAATNTPARFRARIEMMNRLFDSVLGP